MPIIVLKLILTPALIGGAALAARRWGPAVGGWLVSLPLNSGPVTFFLAIDQGPAFAATSVVGSLAGLAAIAGFTLVLAAALLRSGPRAGIGLSVVAFCALGLLLQPILDAPVGIVFLVAFGALAAALRLLPPSGSREAATPHPWWDLPARIAIGTSLVVGLTAIAPVLGAHASGTIATFPVYILIQAMFTYRQEGVPGALDVLRGTLRGLIGTSVFMLALSLALVPLGVGPAFGLGLLVAFASHAVALRSVRADAGREVELESV